ncbi:hypothetical protein GO755_34900 [Spirosoma sp. HMF4905]|uniref:DUF3168 domain-containing protein n=1 Tax=Spirosoma arboris TaxID=2682092 RepID=A0A7K1SNM1_9BACT|nr:hypothetical protein [Spirosoma arboris]MVM35263.1 hypothetical protein [Spirosoma arboris]
MKNPSHEESILYQHISGSALEIAVSGTVYKSGCRPNNSVLEDLVINPLPVNGNQIQQGTCNVNLYVPDLRLLVNNEWQFFPNSERIATLLDLATALLASHDEDWYGFELALTSNPMAVPELKQHYVNLRVDFQFFPTV